MGISSVVAQTKRPDQRRSLEASRITPPRLGLERFVLVRDDLPNSGIGALAQHANGRGDRFRVLGSAQQDHPQLDLCHVFRHPARLDHRGARGGKECDLPLRFTTHRCYPASLHPAAQPSPCGPSLRRRQNRSPCGNRLPSPFGPGPRTSRSESGGLAAPSSATY